MKKIFAVLLTIIMLCTYCLPAQVAATEKSVDTGIGNTGNTYYIDADNGDDSNSGLSEKEAWQTLENVNNITFEPGDAILLKRGCVWTDQWLAPQGSGDKENQNYISCYGDENDPLPSIISRYSDEMDNLPRKDAVVQLWEQSYWTIENLELTNGSEGSGDQAGIDVTNNPADPKSAGIIIRNCKINGSNPKNWSKATKTGLRGIQVYGFFDNITIENNHISNCKSIGIVVNGWRSGVNYKGVTNETCAKGVVVRGNYLENIGKDGILMNNTYEPLVEYNVVYKSHSYATTTAHVALWPFASYGSLFQYNEAYDTQTVYDGQGFDCDYQCYNTTFQYNYSHDNVGGFMLICTEASMQGAYAFNVGSTVRYNISQNDEHYSFNLTGGVQNTRIYNNTIYTGRNTYNATHFFFVFDKGENVLTGLHYPDDVLVANNIFYTDGNCGNELAKCSNLVYKNNMFCGRAQSKAILNGEQTTVTLTKPASSDSDLKYESYETYGIKESSGNIWNQNPMFVDGGSAGIGIDTCDGYQLYEDSPAIGAGVAIEDGHHACPNDYFGNPIDTDAVNIGAYAGKGVERKVTVYDDKYVALFDFEGEEVGATGTGTSGVPMSGIERCNEAAGTVVVTDREDVQNAETDSTKCVQLKNEKDADATVSMKYYLYENELENANGIRLWLDPNGDKTTYTVSFVVEDTVDGEKVTKTYQKTFDVQKTGWKVLTFEEEYNIGTSATKELVTPELMRKMTAMKVSATLASGKSVFVDDIQVNNGEMDEEDPYHFMYDDADVNVVEDFETATLREDRNNSYGAVSSGAGGNTGIREYNGGKAYFALASSDKNTAAQHLFKWTHTFDSLTAAMAEDTEAEGIQITMDMQAEDLTEEEKTKLSDSWDTYTFALTSSNKISYTTTDGKTTKEIASFNYNPVADENNIIRIPFSSMYAKVGSETVYLTDLSEEDRENWKAGLYQFWITITTQGGSVGRALTTTYYMDDLALYKNVKHADAVSRVVKEATCTEDGQCQKLCEKCGAIYDIEVIPATGHNYEWVVTKEPTKIAVGEKQLICTYCSDVSEVQEIPKVSADVTTQEQITEDTEDVTTQDEISTTQENKVTSEQQTETTQTDATTENGDVTTEQESADKTTARVPEQPTTEETTEDAKATTQQSVVTTEKQEVTTQQNENAGTTAGVPEQPTTEEATEDVKATTQQSVVTTEKQEVTTQQNENAGTTAGVPEQPTTEETTEDAKATTQQSVVTTEKQEVTTQQNENAGTTAGVPEQPTTEETTEDVKATTQQSVVTTEKQEVTTQQNENAGTTAGVPEQSSTEETTEDAKATTQVKPVTTELPVTTQKPVTTEQPVTTQKPVTTEQPVTTQKATTTEQPVTTQKTATTEKSATTQGTATTEKIVATQEVVTTQQPATTEQKSTTTQVPVADAKQNTAPIVQQEEYSDEESAEDESIIVGALRYCIICDTEEKREAAVVGIADETVKKIVIPAVITVDGVAYKVTIISQNAFAGNKKMTSVTIGKNVEIIGQKAFFNCAKLKTLKIKTKKLTKKTVQNKAFTNSYKKMKVYVPKKQKKSYKKILRAKGISAKATIK